MLERVQKIMANAGVAARRKCEELIKQGRVKVNGKTITLGDKADPNKDKITLDNRLIKKTQNKIYIAFNKPDECLTTLKSTNAKNVLDYVKVKERIFPIGRLDYHTTGLLLLTNDGEFANKVMHPRYEVKKTYQVNINQPLKLSDKRKLMSGIRLEDFKTAPAKVKTISDTQLEIVIHEGKNRIVRRMLEKLGYKVKGLKRIRIGNIDLKNLEEGKWRFLTEKEVSHLSSKTIP